MGGGGGKVGMGGRGGTAAQATLPQENTAVMARTMGSFMLLGGSSIRLIIPHWKTIAG